MKLERSSWIVDSRKTIVYIWLLRVSKFSTIARVIKSHLALGQKISTNTQAKKPSGPDRESSTITGAWMQNPYKAKKSTSAGPKKFNRYRAEKFNQDRAMTSGATIRCMFRTKWRSAQIVGQVLCGHHFVWLRVCSSSNIGLALFVFENLDGSKLQKVVQQLVDQEIECALSLGSEKR